MNKVQKIVDYYLELTGKPDSEYKKHLRSAKELLTLCDEDTEEVCRLLEISHRQAVGDWSMYWTVKKYLEFSVL
jgi:hypothetical protein